MNIFVIMYTEIESKWFSSICIYSFLLLTQFSVSHEKTSPYALKCYIIMINNQIRKDQQQGLQNKESRIINM